MKVPLTLITVVSESLLKDELLKLMREEGATGFTVTQADGEGSSATRVTEWEGPNVRIETILSAETADRIITQLSETYFDNYGVIAWLTDVSVLRGMKFET
jgi:nitrogen regulatory protein PII